MAGPRQPFLASGVLFANARKGALIHKLAKLQRKSELPTLRRNFVWPRYSLATAASFPVSGMAAYSVAALPSPGDRDAAATRPFLAATSSAAAMAVGIAVATVSFAFPCDQKRENLSKIHPLDSAPPSEAKLTAKGNFDQCGGHPMQQSWGEEHGRHEELSTRDEETALRSPALKTYPTRSPSCVRELGKALAELHEKQNVVLGRMLHDLNQLAQENPSYDGDRSPALLPLDCSIKNLHANGKKYIEVPQELDRITPQEAWHIIQQLQHKSSEEGSKSEVKKSTALSRSDVKRICFTAAQLLRSEPTVIDLRDRKDLEMITVVGDLHGQFESLLDVFELVGHNGFGPIPPSSANRNIYDAATNVKPTPTIDQNNTSPTGTPWDGTGAIVFNGDFVDRGENSLGVLITLLLLKIAFPNHIILNRGNHEDDLLSTVYGFAEELESLYITQQNNSVDDIWEAIGDVFAALPICVCTPAAVILHGGVPSENFALDKLRLITSEERCQVRSVLETEGREMKEMLQNVLWSDPMSHNGVVPNEDRGAGIYFGPDVTKKFLNREGFNFLIRSHEPVDMGYEKFECGDESAVALTVFSAARYPCGEGFNWGAVIRLTRDGKHEPLFFSGQNDRRDEGKPSYSELTFSGLSQVISRRSAELLSSFKEMAKLNQYVSDEEQTDVTSNQSDQLLPLVTQEQWATVMSETLDLIDVDWSALRPYLASVVKKKIIYDDDVHTAEMIDYTHFLDLYCNLSIEVDETLLGNLRRDHSVLLKVFKFLDSDRSGRIDRGEFRVGIGLLNRYSPEGKVIEDPDTLFDYMDIDGDGELDIHEFESAFEASSTPYHIACFKKFDTDNSGFIDREEFHCALQELNKSLPPSRRFEFKDADAIFDRLDTDFNGELDLKEFQQLLRHTGYLPTKM